MRQTTNQTTIRSNPRIKSNFFTFKNTLLLLWAPTCSIKVIARHDAAVLISDGSLRVKCADNGLCGFEWSRDEWRQTDNRTRGGGTNKHATNKPHYPCSIRITPSIAHLDPLSPFSLSWFTLSDFLPRVLELSRDDWSRRAIVIFFGNTQERQQKTKLSAFDIQQIFIYYWKEKSLIKIDRKIRK